jgi:endonuclease YncB( thermonuclease family)
LPYIAAKEVKALDGDTLEATFVLHVDGYDAPELDSQRCNEEQVKAVTSRNRANELLSHPPVRIRILGEDKNGKRGARVVAGDRPLGLMMEFEGHLKPANGGPLNWCPGAATTEPGPLQRMMAVVGR